MPRMDKLSNHRTMWTGDHDHGQVVYVRTTIVAWNREKISLNTGGWRTVTTKRKMNQAAWQFALGYGVSQRKGEWYVSRWDNVAKRWVDEQPFTGDTFTFVRSRAVIAA